MLAALRQTRPGSALVRPMTAAPDLDGWAMIERLLQDLAPLADRVWLVVDDVHELGPDALRQLELLVLRAPPGLPFVLATRRDVRLGLHRLRLEGELAEIREPDLGILLRCGGLARSCCRVTGSGAGFSLRPLAPRTGPCPRPGWRACPPR